MKDRIVIWGQDEKDTDVLIAIRLLQNSDIIKIWTFPKKGIDETFVDTLFKDWKDGAEDNFPQPFTLIERGITEENMLPEGLKTPKTDVIKIAEQEWRVRVLSFRLYEHIKQQIEQLKVRVGNLSIYSKDVWEEAKDVSRSIKENTLDRNIKREQTTELRKGIDEVFDQMKKLQNAEQAKYLEASKNNMVAIRTKVAEVLEKIGSERHTKKLWDKLLAYQQEAKGQEMTPRDRNALRLSFNEAFNALKADIQSNVGNRLNSRINGLKGAIEKMEASIKRDKDNIAYQSGRINKNSTTQLEYQLRSAKLKLIEDRIQSKEQKLHNMYLTLKELESKSVKLPKAKKVNIKAKQNVASSSAAVAGNSGATAKNEVDNVTSEQKAAGDAAKQNDETSTPPKAKEEVDAVTEKGVGNNDTKNTETSKVETSTEADNNVSAEPKMADNTAKPTAETSAPSKEVTENAEVSTKKDVDTNETEISETSKTDASTETVEQKIVNDASKPSVDTSIPSKEVTENSEATIKKDVDTDETPNPEAVKTEASTEAIEQRVNDASTPSVETSISSEEIIENSEEIVAKDKTSIVEEIIDNIAPEQKMATSAISSAGSSIVAETIAKTETVNEVQKENSSIKAGESEGAMQSNLSVEEEVQKSEPGTEASENKIEEE